MTKRRTNYIMFIVLFMENVNSELHLNFCEELECKDTASKMSLNEKMEKRGTAASPELSCVSMKSNASIVMPPNISNEAVTSDPR